MSWPITGEHGQLWLYERATFPRDALYLLWRMVEDERGGALLFHAQANEQIRGDLVEFVQTFTDPGRVLLVAQRMEAPQALMGLIWFDQIEVGRRANVNVWFRRAHWGEAVSELSGLALSWAFETLKLASIWAFTPWPLAGRLAQRKGFERIAVLPDLVMIGGTPKPVDIWRLTKERHHELG